MNMFSSLNKLCEQCAEAMAASVGQEGVTLISFEQRKQNYLLQIQQLVLEQALLSEKGSQALLEALEFLTERDPEHYPKELLVHAKGLGQGQEIASLEELEDLSVQNLYGLSDAELTAFYNAANYRFMEKRYGDAALILNYLCTLNPDNPLYWLALGNAEFHNQRFEQGLEAYAMACLVRPEDPRPQLYAAHCWDALGDREKAIETAKGALEAAHDDPVVSEMANKFLITRKEGT